MDDAIDLIAPPRDIEAGARANDPASIANTRDLEMQEFNVSDFDNPGYVGESRVGYEAVGGE